MSNRPAADGPDPSVQAAEPSSQAVHAGVVRSAGVVSAAVLLSRVTGLVREVAFATFFGAGFSYDAYVAAFRVPNLFRDLLGEGALSSAFVTTFSQQQSRNGAAAAFRLSNLLATVLTPFVGVLCLIGAVFAPQIVDLMFPGFSEIPGKRELTVHLARIMIPFLLFISLAAKAMGALNARGRFAVPSSASAVFNLVSVGLGLALGFWAGPRLGFEPIVGMAIGTLLGGCAQYVVQIPSLRREGLRYEFVFDLSDPALRQVLRLMAPAILGAAAVQVNVVVNSNFASQITGPGGEVINGPVAWLSYSFRFMQLPLGLFGVAIASATLPAISRSAAAGRMDEFRDMLARSLSLVFLLTIPAAVGLIVLSEPLVGLIYQRGRFNAFDTHQTAIALSFYCVGLAGYSAVKLLTPAFYALDEVRAPVVASLLSIGVNFGLNWFFVHGMGWGHWALALATSTVAVLNFLVLFEVLRRRIRGIYGNRLLLTIAKSALASLVMGGLCWAISAGLANWLGAGFLARLATVSGAVAAGAGAVYGLYEWLGVEELDTVRAALTGGFSKS